MKVSESHRIAGYYHVECENEKEADKFESLIEKEFGVEISET